MGVYVVTGGAGFIGNNLVRALLRRGEKVRVIDNFSTGRWDNISDLLPSIDLFEGTVCDAVLLKRAFADADYCIHLAAVPSVPRSVADPAYVNAVNVGGTLDVFLAARDAGVKRVVFASSSAIYGETDRMALREDMRPAPISPYGVSKVAMEMYATTFAALYRMEIVGLRYFNVFGPRQDPKSTYAAVIPVFISKMLAGERPPVYGDGQHTRDFTYVDNAVSANLKACDHEGPISGMYNVACGREATILGLIDMLNRILGTFREPNFLPERAGDITHALADIAAARQAFGYEVLVSVEEGLKRTVEWIKQQKEASGRGT
jgi:UDP-glucose 4-epimerase